MNSRRGRVGKEIAHTLTTSCNQGYYVFGIDMNPEPKVTELARCITARQDSGIGHHKGEKSGVFLITDPIAVLDPAKAETRQQGRRFKLPNEPMFTITVTDRHGVVYCGYIRKLMPLECWRLQGFTDEQFNKVKLWNVRCTALQASRKCRDHKCYRGYWKVYFRDRQGEWKWNRR